MLTLWHLLCSNILVAAVLAVLAAGLSALCRRPALTHGLWLLVLLKLVTPPLVPVTVVLPASTAPAEAKAPAEVALPRGVMPRPDLWRGPELPRPVIGQAIQIVADRADVEEPDEAAELVEDIPDQVAAEDGDDEVPDARPAAAAPAVDWLSPWVPAILAFWLTAAVAWFVVATYRIRQFQRMLRHASPADPALQGRIHALAHKLGLRQGPPAWLVEGCVSPMVWMVGPVRLLLPAGLMARLTEDQRDTLLLHELAHLRRGDVWVRWLEMAVTGLYWWLPLVWWARRELRQAEEECCDAWVVRALPGASRAYARALVEAVDFLSGAPPALPALASGVGPVPLLRRRLTMILRGTTTPKLTAFGLAALLATGALVPLLPSWAQSPDEQNVQRGRRGEEGGERDVQQAEKEVQRMEKALKTIRDAQEKLHSKMAGYERQMKEAIERLKAARDMARDKAAAAKERGKSDDRDTAPRAGKGAGMGGGTMGSKNTDQRLRDVERKLDNVLRELQQLRNELRRGTRAGSGSAFGNPPQPPDIGNPFAGPAPAPNPGRFGGRAINVPAAPVPPAAPADPVPPSPPSDEIRPNR
jgi:beta-lactamase regulating signal transducer with metallopeptidase domain